MKIKMVMRLTTFLIYVRVITRNVEPPDSIDTIQDSLSAGKEIDESAACSINMVRVTQATTRPSRLNPTEAEETKDTW